MQIAKEKITTLKKNLTINSGLKFDYLEESYIFLYLLGDQK